jgi:RNA polymerase sigma-70 factor (ECF subfamily)
MTGSVDKTIRIQEILYKSEENLIETRLIYRMITMMDSNANLDQMIRAGLSDTERFAEALVSQYYAYIHRLTLSILSDPADADDACQETFIDALRYIDRYSPGTNFNAWLSKIAVHKCRQVQRKRVIRNAFYLSRTKEAGLSKAPTPFETASEKERKEQVWKAIDDLSEKHRLPVILYYVYEFKIREVAEILEIPEGTACSRLHNAVKKLGKKLEGLEKSPSKEE